MNQWRATDALKVSDIAMLEMFFKYIVAIFHIVHTNSGHDVTLLSRLNFIEIIKLCLFTGGC